MLHRNQQENLYRIIALLSHKVDFGEIYLRMFKVNTICEAAIYSEPNSLSVCQIDTVLKFKYPNWLDGIKFGLLIKARFFRVLLSCALVSCIQQHLDESYPFYPFICIKTIDVVEPRRNSYDGLEWTIKAYNIDFPLRLEA